MASSDNAKSNQHVLKIYPEPLADLLSGAKTAEVRRNDRGFQVGDTVRLIEVNPETGNWTGAADHVRTISHIQTGYGLPDGICVLSYAQPFGPRNRLPGRLAIRAALPDVPGDMLDHGLFAALDAMAAPPAAAHGDEVDQFFEQVKAELRRARAKFPGDRIMTLALAEEFGELCKAVLDESAEAVRKEAVQVACMAARVVLDGDGSVVDWRRERGLDPLLADAAMRAQGDGEVQ